MLVCAIVAVGTEIAIPLLTKSMIDGAISHGDRALLLPIGAAAVGLGAAQALLNFLRRSMQASAVAEIEQSMRADTRAPAAAGTLFPRRVAVRPAAAAGDHGPVGHPAVRRVRHHLPGHERGNVHRGGRAADPAELVARPPRGDRVPARGGGSPRFSQTYRVLARRAQDRQGDLATYVEEAATGSGYSRRSAGRRGRRAAPRPGTPGVRHRTAEGAAAQHLVGWPEPRPNALVGVLLLLAPSRSPGTS